MGEGKTDKQIERRNSKMEWQVILVLVLTIPLALLPVAFVWHLTIGGIYSVIKEAMQKKATPREEIEAIAKQHAS